MEYVYAALILHELGGKITQAKVKGILEAAGATLEPMVCTPRLAAP